MALTKVVLNAVPFQFTDVPDVNPVPVKVRPIAELPAVAVEGLMAVKDGSAVIVNSCEPVPPDTVTVAVPTVARKVAGTVVVS